MVDFTSNANLRASNVCVCTGSRMHFFTYAQHHLSDPADKIAPPCACQKNAFDFQALFSLNQDQDLATDSKVWMETISLCRNLSWHAAAESCVPLGYVFPETINSPQRQCKAHPAARRGAVSCFPGELCMSHLCDFSPTWGRAWPLYTCTVLIMVLLWAVGLVHAPAPRAFSNHEDQWREHTPHVTPWCPSMCFSLFRDFAFPICSALTSLPGATEINGNFLSTKAGLVTRGFLKMEQLKQWLLGQEEISCRY